MRRFELAPDRTSRALHYYVAQVLDAFSHPEALVTDETKVYDFLEHIARATKVRIGRGPWITVRVDPQEVLEEDIRNKQTMHKALARLNVMVEEDDLVIDVAKRLKVKQYVS